jgi:plastocyanin
MRVNLKTAKHRAVNVSPPPAVVNYNSTRLVNSFTLRPKSSGAGRTRPDQRFPKPRRVFVMQVSKYAVLASVIALVACGGGDQSAESAPPAAAPAATTPAAAPAPITGTTHLVHMVLNAAGEYRFDPTAITIKPGDGIRFDFVSGGPHNVAFDPAQFASNPAAKAALMANMTEQIAELSGKMLNAVGESYTISFGNVPPGTYEANCTPHLAMGMKMQITVQ